ncbi:hypothetical protein UCMB321_3185 [Pseudomonas batumici]|uniref:Uncharacterized protein n=1 Tax=Pseudomonas batumici TaxID=226910 RepID=A0A0C2I7V4_9PSED|nr:hypothetical protein UCMB321_3185 [Pseudomonas batumici]
MVDQRYARSFAIDGTIDAPASLASTIADGLAEHGIIVSAP